MIPLAFIALNALGVLVLSIGQHLRLRGGKLLVGLWVATCVIPLLGLLGTIAGLTMAFDSVSSAAADQRAAMLRGDELHGVRARALRDLPRVDDRRHGADPAGLTPGPSPAGGEGSS
jgi:hypothetical protein